MPPSNACTTTLDTAQKQLLLTCLKPSAPRSMFGRRMQEQGFKRKTPFETPDSDKRRPAQDMIEYSTFCDRILARPKLSGSWWIF